MCHNGAAFTLLEFLFHLCCLYVSVSKFHTHSFPFCLHPYFSYGLIWISTTLVFVLSSFGNCATYIMRKRSETVTSWTFDVSYVNVATCTIYGYTFIVPLGFYFLLQYLGLNASLIRFWCMWGYSLFIFIPTSVSLLYIASLFILPS